MRDHSCIWICCCVNKASPDDVLHGSWISYCKTFELASDFISAASSGILWSFKKDDADLRAFPGLDEDDAKTVGNGKTFLSPGYYFCRSLLKCPLGDPPVLCIPNTHLSTSHTLRTKKPCLTTRWTMFILFNLTYNRSTTFNSRYNFFPSI